MAGDKEQAQRYMTVGELAEQVGVTVRTIQYYDQADLLKPSAKGSRNQRLYTSKDEETLYQILCMKFMGLSLTEIRENLEHSDTPEAVQALLQKKIDDAEKEMAALMKRFATLKNLSKTIEGDRAVDWSHYAHVIERFQDEGKYLWKLSCSYEENAYREQELEQDRAQQWQATVEQWHKLMVDVLVMTQRQEPPNSEKSQDAASRYLEIKKILSAFPEQEGHHSFVLFDSTEQHKLDDAFYDLRHEIYHFLQEAVKHQQEQENGGA